MKENHCRLCNGSTKKIISLGKAPLPNYFPTTSEKTRFKKYPLILSICQVCGLGQLTQTITPKKIFSQYHFLSGSSAPLVSHLKSLAQKETEKLEKDAKVIDIGSNDGTLLSFFQKKGVKIVAVEPAKNIVKIARRKMIPTVEGFFNKETAKKLRDKYGRFDLITAIHVLANVPDLASFMKGVKLLLSPNGKFVAEVSSFPYMLKHGIFDSIYHEHYSYFTAQTLHLLCNLHGLKIDSLQKIPYQGESIRIEAQHWRTRSLYILNTRDRDDKYLRDITQFKKKVLANRKKIQTLVKKFSGKTMVGYGAPAKAVTLVNYCRLSKYISYIVDSTTLKFGRYLPGTDIPIFLPEKLQGEKHCSVFLFSWNYQDFSMTFLKKVFPKSIPVIIPFPKARIEYT